MTSDHEPTPIWLAPDHAEMLAAIGFGLSVKRTAAIMGVSAPTVGRWRQSLEDSFGTPNMLELLVRFMQDGTLRLSDFYETFAEALDQYAITRQALTENRLTPDERSALLEAIPRYPGAARAWVSQHYPPKSLEIFAKARIRIPDIGSFGLVVAVAAEIGDIQAADIAPPGRVTVHNSFGGVDMVWKGRPGTSVSGTITIDGEEFTVDFTFPGTKPRHSAGPAD